MLLRCGGTEPAMNITIDGKVCECEKGEYLLDVAKRNKIFIPTLCHHEGLGSLGACRVCIVEVLQNGQSKIVVSCVYPVEYEIEVFTASDKVKEQRGVILALLARLAPGAKVIQQMASFSGADMPRLKDKEGGDTCILCGRCTTACELVGSGAIAKIDRGTAKAIDTPYGAPSDECIGCASCAHVCPTDSIPYTETATTVEIWGRTFDLPLCEVCGNPLSIDERIAAAAQTDDEDEALLSLCTVCRKKEVAAKIKRATRV